MFLLRLHISISMLLLIMGEGTRFICKTTIKKNGYLVHRGILNAVINSIVRLLMYFIPGINVLTVIAIYLMIIYSRDEMDQKFKNK